MVAMSVDVLDEAIVSEGVERWWVAPESRSSITYLNRQFQKSKLIITI
jgi:hypothetical protein